MDAKGAQPTPEGAENDARGFGRAAHFSGFVLLGTDGKVRRIRLKTV
jgi:hypothetical protein